MDNRETLNLYPGSGNKTKFIFICKFIECDKDYKFYYNLL